MKNVSDLIGTLLNCSSATQSQTHKQLLMILLLTKKKHDFQRVCRSVAPRKHPNKLPISAVYQTQNKTAMLLLGCSVRSGIKTR